MKRDPHFLSGSEIIPKWTKDLNIELDCYPESHNREIVEIIDIKT